MLDAPKNNFIKSTSIIINSIRETASKILKKLFNEPKSAAEEARAAKGELTTLLKAIKNSKSLSEISALASQAKSIIDMYPDELQAYRIAIEEMVKQAQAALEREQASGQKNIEAAEAQLRLREQSIIDGLAKEAAQLKSDLDKTYTTTKDLVGKVLNGTEEEKAIAMKSLIEKNSKKDSIEFNNKAVDYLDNFNQRIDVYKARKERNGGTLTEKDTTELYKLIVEKEAEKGKIIDENVTRVIVRAAEIHARGSDEVGAALTPEQSKSAAQDFESNYKNEIRKDKIKAELTTLFEQAEMQAKSGHKQGEFIQIEMENLAITLVASKKVSKIQEKPAPTPEPPSPHSPAPTSGSHAGDYLKTRLSKSPPSNHR